MEVTDTMVVTFGCAAQERRYETLSQREMGLTAYADDSTMTVLGIRESVYFMLNQIGWDGLLTNRSPTYRNLTLEFLSSLHYDPDSGLGFSRGSVSFRLFGFTYRFTTREFADVLGFPRSIDALIEVDDNHSPRISLTVSGLRFLASTIATLITGFLQRSTTQQ